MLINELLKKKEAENFKKGKVSHNRVDRAQQKIDKNKQNNTPLVENARDFISNWVDSPRFKNKKDKYGISTQSANIKTDVKTTVGAAFKKDKTTYQMSDDNIRIFKTAMGVSTNPKTSEQEKLNITADFFVNDNVRGINLNNKSAISKFEPNENKQLGVQVHEFTHSFDELQPTGRKKSKKYYPEKYEANDNKIISESKNKMYETFGTGKELYPRIMGFRAENKLKPETVITKDNFRGLPNTKAQNLHEIVGEDALIYLLNELPK